MGRFKWRPGEMMECSLLPELLIGLCRPAGPQPKDYLQYYGFSSFAMELNELTADLKHLLPPTDSRLRPDQR